MEKGTLNCLKQGSEVKSFCSISCCLPYLNESTANLGSKSHIILFLCSWGGGAQKAKEKLGKTWLLPNPFHVPID